MTERPEITGLPAIPETALTEALVASLPANLAGAPWECTCSALLWLGRGGSSARQALPPTLREESALMVVGGMVRYTTTPVGPYDEVLGIVGSRAGVRPWGNVAFMAVDSPESLVGGRTNWGMPKTLAGFTGSPVAGGTMTATSADGTDWTVSASPRALGPAVPLRGVSVTRQELFDGSIGASKLSFRGQVRPALVTVEVSSHGSLGSWLRPGRHVGAIVESATFTLGVPAVES